MNRAHYQKGIDVLKGIAIIAVVLYHLGIVKTGYLGVDVFFVINGFLIIPGIVKKLSVGEFSCKEFLVLRVMRLLPLLVVGCLVCLLVGYIGMLPDDYENLSQSVVASLVFSNNLLAAITTKDYWNIVNEYKPLMHTWYLGILVEFYVILAITGLVVKGVAKLVKMHLPGKLFQGILAMLTVLSLMLFLLPIFSDGIKFYGIPFRIFELSLGGFVGIYAEKLKQSKFFGNPWFSACTLLLLIIVVFSSIFSGAGVGTQVIPIGAPEVQEKISFLPGNALLIVTVVLSCLILCGNGSLLNSNVLAYLGKRSYSIFIWHQIVVAFYRYFISKNISFAVFVLYITIILLLSECSYRFIEKVRVGIKSIVITMATAGAMIVAAFLIYLNAGVVRDVPELNIGMDNVHRGMHAEYVERIYAYDMDFPEKKDKINVLVVGNSFARDWANVLLESPMADSINLSYSFDFYETENLINRIKKSDFIFSFSTKEEVPQFVWECMQANVEIWGIGTKNFGECNGIIYAKRFLENYYEQTIELDEAYEALNNQWKNSWGENYINFIAYASTEEGRIRVFSPEYQFISQDCEHLTQGGARYYAEIIDFGEIFDK